MPRCPETGARAARSQRGFTLLELTIVIMLVVLLFVTAYNRLMPLRGQAEAAHVATTIGSLRSALGLTVAERVLAGDAGRIETLEGSNPMRLLAEVPQRYAEKPLDADRGDWFFDPATGTLRYRLRYPQYLAGERSDPVELAWRIEVERSSNESEAAPRVRSIRLVALDNPEWRFEESAPNLANQP